MAVKFLRVGNRGWLRPAGISGVGGRMDLGKGLPRSSGRKLLTTGLAMMFSAKSMTLASYVAEKSIIWQRSDRPFWMRIDWSWGAANEKIRR